MRRYHFVAFDNKAATAAVRDFVRTKIFNGNPGYPEGLRYREPVSKTQNCFSMERLIGGYIKKQSGHSIFHFVTSFSATYVSNSRNTFDKPIPSA
jgi:hypothetical protein